MINRLIEYYSSKKLILKAIIFIIVMDKTFWNNNTWKLSEDKTDDLSKFYNTLITSKIFFYS